jgi:hypothetical protein
MHSMKRYTVFAGHTIIAVGTFAEILPVCQARQGDGGPMPLIFEDANGKQIDFDFSGTEAEVLERVKLTAPSASRGRPQLGVISREITLLPQQWEWLQAQPASASATIRRLIEQARRENDPARESKERAAAAGAFLTAIVGNAQNFEEVTRALYSHDRSRFQQLLDDYPVDVRNYAVKLLFGSE